MGDRSQWDSGWIPATFAGVAGLGLTGSLTAFVTSDYQCRPCAWGNMIFAGLLIGAVCLAITGPAYGWWYALPAVWLILLPALMLARAWAAILVAVPASLFAAWRIRRWSEDRTDRAIGL